ncbi:MAG: hypothetical protein QM682_02750 [Paracoccus sp. (in: a-proteobacteria)]|uniref:hypothetical protein n=1 Tax=Paracoccus sp. TaxID=267 RepID=UPI0039E40962
MKLTIEPTPEIITVDGCPVRIWIGTDENGTQVRVFVRAVSPQTHDQALLEAFEQELRALPMLKPAVIDYRFFAD